MLPIYPKISGDALLSTVGDGSEGDKSEYWKKGFHDTKLLFQNGMQTRLQKIMEEDVVLESLVLGIRVVHNHQFQSLLTSTHEGSTLYKWDSVSEVQSHTSMNLPEIKSLIHITYEHLDSLEAVPKVGRVTKIYFRTKGLVFGFDYYYFSEEQKDILRRVKLNSLIDVFEHI